MWGFIAFIVLVAIIFGVTLHQAFWGIVGVAVVLFGLGWMFLTGSGKKFAMWSLAILGFCFGVFLCYDGITKKMGNEQVYKNDIHSCEHDTWRYERAKVYTNNHTSYYYDENKVKTIGDKCVQDAVDNKKQREDWWLIETFVGGMVLIYSIVLPKEMQKDKKVQVKKH